MMRRSIISLANSLILLSVALSSAAMGNAQTPSTETQTLVRILDLYRTKNCSEGISVMEPFVTAHPDNIEVRMLLGDCYLRLENWRGATSQFQAVLALAPSHVDALKGLRQAGSGPQVTAKREDQARRDSITHDDKLKQNVQDAESAIRSQQYPEARRALKEILAEQPTNTAARQRLAEVFSASRQFDKAVAQYRLLQAVPALKAEATLQIARNLEWNRKFTEAAAAYRQYLLARTGEVEARRGLANVLMWSAHYAEAAQEYEKLQEVRGVDAQIQLALADCYEHMARTESALQAYEAVLRVAPDNATALKGRDKIRQTLEEQPRRDGYRYLEAGDLEASAHSFEKYLASHPDSDVTIIQLARLRSWMQQYPAAVDHYRAYLKNNGTDIAARRELARVLGWSYQYADALHEFEALATGPGAIAEDFEHLVQINLWISNIPAAAAYAEQLRKIDPENAIGAQAVNLYREQTARLERESAERTRLADRNVADTLAATGRFKEAVGAYTTYMSNYGYDRMIELTIARLHSWAADYDGAAKRYSSYLGKYPDDLRARYELGNVESWSKHFPAAKAQYEAVLAKDSENVEARIALARVGDYSVEDRVAVLQLFKDVLAIDPANEEAKSQAGRIRLEVAPMATYSASRFQDSDGLERFTHSLQTSFTFRGRVRVEPSVVYSEFSQNRFIATEAEAADEINRRIESIGGRTEGRGAYVGLRVDRSHWSLATRGGAFRYNYNAADYLPHSEVSLELRPAVQSRIQLNFKRSEAASELNTIGSVVAAMQGTSGELVYRQLIGNRIALTMSGGLTQYSSQEAIVQSETVRRRGIVRLDFIPSKNLSIGYVGRLNRYDRESPLYFSPDIYDMHGLAYRISGHIVPALSLTLDGEVGRSLVRSTSSIESALAGRLAWRIRPSLEIRSMYRWGRSSTTAFGSSMYRADSFELGLSKVF